MFRSAIELPTWWAPSGFAAIPTTALDPPHCAASPAVPALHSGPGPHRRIAPAIDALQKEDLGAHAADATASEIR